MLEYELVRFAVGLGFGRLFLRQELSEESLRNVMLDKECIGVLPSLSQIVELENPAGFERWCSGLLHMSHRLLL